VSIEQNAPNIAVWSTSSAMWNSFTRSCTKFHDEAPPSAQHAGEKHQRDGQAVYADVVADARVAEPLERYSSWNSIGDLTSKRSHAQTVVRKLPIIPASRDRADLPFSSLAETRATRSPRAGRR